MKKINPQALLIAKYLNEWLEYHVPSIKACSPHTKRNYETHPSSGDKKQRYKKVQSKR